MKLGKEMFHEYRRTRRGRMIVSIVAMICIVSYVLFQYGINVDYWFLQEDVLQTVAVILIAIFLIRFLMDFIPYVIGGDQRKIVRLMEEQGLDLSDTISDLNAGRVFADKRTDSIRIGRKYCLLCNNKQYMILPCSSIQRLEFEKRLIAKFQLQVLVCSSKRGNRYEIRMGEVEAELAAEYMKRVVK